MNRMSLIGTLRIQKQIWQICLLCLFISMVFGCSLTIPVSPDDAGDSSSTAVDHAPAEEIWKALSHAVDAGTIDTTTRLAQYVAILARNGELSAGQVAAFDAAFPSISRNERPLTSQDSQLLRTLK